MLVNMVNEGQGLMGERDYCIRRFVSNGIIMIHNHGLMDNWVQCSWVSDLGFGGLMQLI